MPASSHLIALNYEGHPVTYRDDGWFNATEAASRYGKRPGDFLDLPSTKEYVAALDADASITGKSGNWTMTRRGNAGGTWLHPKLGVRFAQWLDAKFAVWCDKQIDNLIHGKQDWAQQRHAATAGAKLLALTLKTAREAEGKETQHFHYSNEHLMLNELITGQRKGCDRDAADGTTLDALAQMQVRDSMLILKQMPYKERQSDIRGAVQSLTTYARLPVANMIPAPVALKLKTKKAANDSK